MKLVLDFIQEKDETDMSAKELYFRDLKEKLNDPNFRKVQEEKNKEIKFRKSLEKLKRKLNGR